MSAGTIIHYSALQLPVSYFMHFSGTEAAGWCVLLLFLVKAHAKTELLPEERRTVSTWMRWRGKVPQKILAAVRAIEMHMALSCIVMGSLQSIVILYIGKVSSCQLRYQRTPSKGRVSEATVMSYLRKYFFRLLGQSPELRITQIIQELQNESGIYSDSLAS